MSTLHLSIGLAGAGDARAIAELSRRHVEQGLGWKYTPAHVRRLMRDVTKNVVVARADDCVAGFGIMSYGDTTANLDLLAVQPACRGQGVGRRLVSWLESVARDAGINTVFVQVRRGNRSAIAFYQVGGYQVIDQVRGYYHGREDAVILSHRIGAAVMPAKATWHWPGTNKP